MMVRCFAALPLPSAARETLEDALEGFRERGLPVVIIATKMDKLGKSSAAQRVRDLEREVAGWPVIPFSAMTRDGRRPVLAWIDGVLEEWSGPFRA